MKVTSRSEALRSGRAGLSLKEDVKPGMVLTSFTFGNVRTLYT